MSTSAAVLTPIEGSESLAARVEDRLRMAILAGELPPGARLSVPDLARRFGVSRTPVREAVSALERAGLAVVRPRHGALVFGGGREDLTHLYELRGALDGLAAGLAANRMDARERAELQDVMARHTAAIRARDVEKHVACDIEFHRLIRDGAHNPRLSADLARLQDQILLVLRSMATQPGAMGRGVLHDHTAILAAIVRRDAADAERAARDHVAAVLRFVLDATYQPEVRT